MKNKKIAIKIILLLILFCSFVSELPAQNLLAQPESICYDSLTRKYYVSNYQNGKIIQIDSSGVQTYLIEGFGHCLGSVLHNNVLYFSTGKYVKGYNISASSPVKVMDLYIPESQQLDGMTVDNNGNLYVCDYHYPGTNDMIMKIVLSTQSYSIFVPPGLGLSESPQDVVFDAENNRLILANYSNNYPIQAVSLADSSVTNISSSITGLDGITRDNLGNYYLTSWTTYAVYKYNKYFSGTPEQLVSASGGPAQPCFNPHKNIIVVPLFNTHGLLTIPLITNNIKQESGLTGGYVLYQNFPNPFNPATVIKFSLPESGFVMLKVYNIIGETVAILINEKLQAGNYSYDFNAPELTCGVYFYKLTSGKFSETKKMILNK